MRKITQKEWDEAVKEHKNWRKNEGGARLDFSGCSLKEIEIESGADLSGAYLIGANLSGANLSGANLRGANLRGADLRGADLSGADLSGANLIGANLIGVYHLRGANLSGANLRGANLRGAEIDWMNHSIIAEILRRAASDDIAKRKLAGLVLISTDWCWETFLKLRDKNRKWALDELAGWVKDGDNAPDLLRKRAKRLQKEANR